MKKLIKRIMFCHNARVLSYIVAALHLVWSSRIFYFITLDLIDFSDEDNLQLSEDGIFDMPIPAVRYLVLLFLLVLISSVLLIIGVVMNRSLCVSSFLLTMMIFVLTFTVFAVWGVFASFLKGTPIGEIFLEFLDDSALLVCECLMLYPVFLVLSDITETFDEGHIRPTAVSTNSNNTRGHAL